MKIQIKQVASYMALGAAILVGSPQVEAQYNRGDRLSLAAGMGLGIAASRSELDGMSVNLDFVPTVRANYLKNVHPFLDLRLGAGIQGIIFDGFQLQENVGAFSEESSIRGLSLYGEILPIYFTNPNRLGYLQADLLFYMGSGVGAMRSFVRERNVPVLSENDLVKAEFGFDNRHQTSSRSLTNPVPFPCM